MKRFWSAVAIVAADGDHGILLDGKPVRTPARAALLLPTPALAEAVAAEWRDQGETVDPRAMPMTGLANAAIDQVGGDRAGFVARTAAYGETDLLCYRADAPQALVERQTAAWDPLLAWARARYDVAFVTTAGIVHVAQPQATLDRLADAVAAHGAYQLAALSPLVTISGSLLVTLALAEGELDADTGFAVSHLDELWQVERWGEDDLATETRVARQADFAAAARFLGLV